MDEYIFDQLPENQILLIKFRDMIKQEVPEAQEAISYQMPTFKLYGNLVHFAVFKNHVGFYPAPSGISAFATELISYKTSKGAIQFPKDKPIPWDLIRKIVKFRVEENKSKSKLAKNRNRV